MLEATPGGGSASDDVFSTAYMPPTGSDLSSGVSPSRSGENLFQHLPAQLTSLIGREKEIEAVCALLQRKEVRLLTLSGTGGIGKTRLGIEVASRLSESFADGIVFVPLAPIIHPRLVLSTIKHALGLEQSIRDQGTRHLDDLKAFLRNRHLLLVLDNFEQVLPAAPDLVDLLLACPHLKLLVTSRAVLHVQGEYEFVVPPLALPRWTHLPAIDVLAQYASVAMFIEGALAIKPDLHLTMANMQAIASICVHLDGIPLAIELAAARVKLLPLPGLFRQLSQTHRLDILTGGSRDLPERQQTLRKTIDFAKGLDIETIQVSLGHAYPGTEFYDYAQKNNLVSINGMHDGAGHQLPNVIYPHLDKGELVDWVERFYGEYYFRPKAAWRVVKKAVQNNDLPRLYKEAREYLSLRSKRKQFVKEQREAAVSSADTATRRSLSTGD